MIRADDTERIDADAVAPTCEVTGELERALLYCPVHTGTPEPCPECGSKIAAGL